MHDDGVRPRQLHALWRDLELRDVVLEADVLAGQSLFLDAQRHHDIGSVHCSIEIVASGDSGSNGCSDIGHKIGRAAEDDLGAELGEQHGVGARDAAMKNVADDDDAQSLQPLLVVGDGQGIEQRLRRMLM
jgi:hypothetical protein